MIEPFGEMPDGRPVARITLRAGPVTARIIPFGATLQALETPDRDGTPDDVVLGHDTLQGYLAHRGYFGATVGRVANRIAGAAFTLDAEQVALTANEGANMLHGGPDGFDRRLWEIEDHDDRSVTLTLLSPNGDQGFPGQLLARVRYQLDSTPDGAALCIAHSAITDAATPVALTNHSFFALAGARGLAARPHSALDYRLRVPAARYLPVDAQMIPLGPAPVAATPFDFRTGRQPLTAVRSGVIAGYDHCLCLDQGQAELYDATTGRRMVLETDQVGLQVYTGNFLDGRVRGKQGRAYARHDAICLEPQPWPNAVNMPPGSGAPDVILRPAETYRAEMRLLFSTGG